jgi:hypothetical protein
MFCGRNREGNGLSPFLLLRNFPCYLLGPCWIPSMYLLDLQLHNNGGGQDHSRNREKKNHRQALLFCCFFNSLSHKPVSVKEKMPLLCGLHPEDVCRTGPEVQPRKKKERPNFHVLAVLPIHMKRGVLWGFGMRGFIHALNFCVPLDRFGEEVPCVCVCLSLCLYFVCVCMLWVCFLRVRVFEGVHGMQALNGFFRSTHS